MMHGREKSDPTVVATKPSNKACVSCKASAAEGGSAAEMVEPRVGTEGNADQRSTLRTQGRDSVTQGLGRIRQAAYQPLRRQAPEVGAVCGKAARTVLCGGCSVMGIPTATPWPPAG